MLAAEEVGVPAVGVIVPMFEELCHFVAANYERPDAKFVLWPGAIATFSEAKVKEVTEKEIFDQIIEKLTKESRAASSEAEDTVKDPEEVLCTGTFGEVNDFFYDNGWTDGLPIIPPTREAVEEMLKWTDMSPHEEIAVLPMANRKATPWGIAVNAVMAGCLPEYMPVLIAAVQAMADPAYRVKDIGTTGCVKPFFVINGPIIKQLDLNYGTGLTAPGRRANSTIGRALHLILRNIAGFKEGITWMGTFGWPGNSFVMAEDEDASPWPPFHTERGFDRNASTVTACMLVHASHQIETGGETSQLHLAGICNNMRRMFHPAFFWFRSPDKRITLLIAPPNAAAIARDGYSKEDVKRYVIKNARLKVDEINKEFAYTEKRVEPWTVHSQAELGIIPKEWDIGPDEEIPFLESPDLVDIFVCGSRERNRNLIYSTVYGVPTTREIRLPADWKQRLEKLEKQRKGVRKAEPS